MKISDGPGDYLPYAYASDSGGSVHKPETDESNATRQSREVQSRATVVKLSGSSVEMAVAQNAVDAAPDLRAEKVEQIRQAIQDGRYQVNADRVAEKLIGSFVDKSV